MSWEHLQEEILEVFVESATWSADDAFKAMSLHVHWHTERLARNTSKQNTYRASLAQDATKRAKRLAAKRACAKAAYDREKRRS